MTKFVEIAHKIVNSSLFKYFLFSLILLSAVVIGLETYAGLAKQYQGAFSSIDKLIITLFTIEIALKIISNGKRPWIYFSDPWNVFDFLIVAICLLPFGEPHYFASFILIGAMIIMNLFIGVIMNSMEESQNELSQELNEIKFRDKNTDELYKHIVTRLDD
jgi:hypothetical protein